MKLETDQNIFKKDIIVKCMISKQDGFIQYKMIHAMLEHIENLNAGQNYLKTEKDIKE